MYLTRIFPAIIAINLSHVYLISKIIKKKTKNTQLYLNSTRSLINIYISLCVFLFYSVTVMKPNSEGAWWRDEGKEQEEQQEEDEEEE